MMGCILSCSLLAKLLKFFWPLLRAALHHVIYCLHPRYHVGIFLFAFFKAIHQLAVGARVLAIAGQLLRQLCDLIRIQPHPTTLPTRRVRNASMPSESRARFVSPEDDATFGNWMNIERPSKAGLTTRFQ